MTYGNSSRPRLRYMLPKVATLNTDFAFFFRHYYFLMLINLQENREELEVLIRHCMEFCIKLTTKHAPDTFTLSGGLEFQYFKHLLAFIVKKKT